MSKLRPVPLSAQKASTPSWPACLSHLHLPAHVSRSVIRHQLPFTKTGLSNHPAEAIVPTFVSIVWGSPRQSFILFILINHEAFSSSFREADEVTAEQPHPPVHRHDFLIQACQLCLIRSLPPNDASFVFHSLTLRHSSGLNNIDHCYHIDVISPETDIYKKC